MFRHALRHGDRAARALIGAGAYAAVGSSLWSNEEAIDDPMNDKQIALLDNRSDYAAFAEAGIPVGGLFTGAEGTKSAGEATSQGGQAGEAYDACYHLLCDGLDNLDEEVFELNMRAAAYALDYFASDPSELASLADVRRPATALRRPLVDRHGAGCEHHLDR